MARGRPEGGRRRCLEVHVGGDHIKIARALAGRVLEMKAVSDAILDSRVRQGRDDAARAEKNK